MNVSTASATLKKLQHNVLAARVAYSNALENKSAASRQLRFNLRCAEESLIEHCASMLPAAIRPAIDEMAGNYRFRQQLVDQFLANPQELNLEEYALRKTQLPAYLEKCVDAAQMRFAEENEITQSANEDLYSKAGQVLEDIMRALYKAYLLPHVQCEKVLSFIGQDRCEIVSEFLFEVAHYPHFVAPEATPADLANRLLHAQAANNTSLARQLNPESNEVA